MSDRELLELVLEKVSSMDGKMGKMDERMAKMDERMEKMDGKMAKMDERLDKMDGKVGKMDERLDKMDGKIEEMDEKIGKMDQDLQAVKLATLEIADSVKRIESTQERHERTLDLLSRRSIDQEAEIRRIK